MIIGAGIAGLSAALQLKDSGQVTVITRGKLKQANSYWAQGGVAAVVSPEDTFERHVKDTIEAGVEHNDPDAVRVLVENGPKAIRFLESIGVKFKEDPALEAGHSVARIRRTSDFTGQDILNALIKAVGKVKTITIEENTDAVELITHENRCHGAYVRKGESAEAEPFFAKYIILATGGLGQIFAKTSNTPASAGDGIALAVKAGLEPKDLEFIQFHPTALDKQDGERYFLLSETLRGFGAKILNSKKQRFLQDFDHRGELAQRDVVTRAVFFEMMNGPVYLDMRHIEAKDIKKRFPNITKRLKQYGFDLTKELIPITPVAHFSCGGIPVDITGATELPGLYAIGETACSGVHGANRLASNALLEGVVYGMLVGKTLERIPEESEEMIIDENIPLEPPKIIIESLPQVMAYAKRIGQIMWEKAGIIRSTAGLREALKEIEGIPARDYRIQNRQIVCYKIIQACLNRPQSLGCHYIAEEPA